MTTEFFNFGSDETFHFFRWVCATCNPEALIAAAFDEAKDIKDVLESSTYHTVRDQLGRKLGQILDDLGYDWGAHPDMCELFARNPLHGAPGESLFLPLLVEAMDRIDCYAVAEALMIRAGKWAPGPIETPKAV
jgi:hypothetical protein